MKQKYYWKVVKIVTDTSGAYASALISGGKYHLFYHIGVPTKSAMQENGIFVFTTRKQARNFRSNLLFKRNMRIFKCEVEGKEIKNPVYYSTLDLTINRKHYLGYIFPQGTRSFPSITLIK